MIYQLFEKLSGTMYLVHIKKVNQQKGLGLQWAIIRG